MRGHPAGRHSSLVDFDAIILTGGAATRLDGADKASLLIDGRTLLERTLDAVHGARRVMVVGAAPKETSTDQRVAFVREKPVGGGPAAAIGAGVRALGDGPSVVVVLACDMPGIAAALPTLLDTLASAPTSVPGVLARDGDRTQYLAGAHRVAALRAAIERHASLHGASVRSLLADLGPHVVDVPGGSTADIDTWDDAVAAGVTVEPIADA